MPATMTPEAKSRLSATIRALRAELLDRLDGELDGAWRLGAPIDRAGLDPATKARRARFEAWVEEQARAVPEKARPAARARARAEVVKEAAYTLLNRLVYLRLLEAAGLSKPAVITGGWESRGYQELRDFAPGLCGDPSEGYGFLLELVFGELAQELPGLYGEVGLTRLVPVPPDVLRRVVTALDEPALASCWTDDTTLGWVYQYWNDPERESLDARLNDGEKLANHDLASKTQMFTERYMVEWLLQNSLGTMWLATCQKHGWGAAASSSWDGGAEPPRNAPPVMSGVLASLEERRAEWRARREAGDVAPDALMPIAEGLEERWKYWVPQPIAPDMVDKAPASLRDLRLLDPACGSGHFLVIAFELLFWLYREERDHRLARGEDADWSDQRIARFILEDNLHGIDLDPRAVQIAAAALLLKARTLAPGVAPRHMNLVASDLRLGALPADDPAVRELKAAVRQETGIPEALVDRLVTGLRDAAHLGSLLRVDGEIADELARHEEQLSRVGKGQLGLFSQRREEVTPEAARASVLEQIERFLARHGGSDDLGLRLRGEQLAKGVRFVRMLREGSYDLVVGNPPYQGTAKMADAAYVAKHYPRGKADLYAAFLERGLQLVREGGVSALLTMRNWMFIKQYAGLREHLLKTYDLRVLGDFDRGAFEDIPDEVVAVVLSVFRRAPPSELESVAVQPTPLDDKTRDAGRTGRKRAGVLAGVGTNTFQSSALSAIPDTSVVYWWSLDELAAFADAQKLGDVTPAKFGINLGSNVRFLAKSWEIERSTCPRTRTTAPWDGFRGWTWTPYIKGAEGLTWFDPGDDVCRWTHLGLEVKVSAEHNYGTYTRKVTNERYYFAPGIAFVMIGKDFAARAHRWRSVIDGKGSSLYPSAVADTLALMNATKSRHILESLNPGLDFTVGDVNRLPLFPIESADEIYATLDRAFTEHEAARETSVEFKRPGPSPWVYAQDWAQRAVDRAAGEPLPPYEPVYEPPRPADFVTFAFGVAMGRFDANGAGLLESPPQDSLPGGVLVLGAGVSTDDLDTPAAAPLRAAWAAHGDAVARGVSLRDWLRTKLFDHHRKQYENRPIWWPLSSDKKSFVAWVAIHRMGPDTLRGVRARLEDLRKELDGRLDDLKQARASTDRAAAAEADDQWSRVSRLRDELAAFIGSLAQLAEKGPPDQPGLPARETDARYAPVLDDGVMVNAAALWPVLDPQWKDPRTWWKELATAKGRKDYDWSRLAARYFPARVDAKCQKDPSLAVAHGCFWRYHPARAYAWELRLQDELRPDFEIEEAGAASARAAFLHDHPDQAADLREKERRRRERARARAGEDEAPLLEDGAGDDDT